MLRKLSLLALSIFLIASCSDVLLVEDISNDTIQILAPTNNATLSEGSLSFNWQALEGIENYQLQIATPNFANANQVVLDTLISTTNFIQSLEANNYEWRVRGVNSAYETLYTISTFTVQ